MVGYVKYWITLSEVKCIQSEHLASVCIFSTGFSQSFFQVRRVSSGPAEGRGPWPRGGGTRMVLKFDATAMTVMNQSFWVPPKPCYSTSCGIKFALLLCVCVG
jgi:hypothetical protein